MNKKQARRRRDIKSKLMAAICMLLVSSIMMVSTTYAWFTLSTAPEVTGINTAVGANGNLEMALLPESGLLEEIKSEAGDSTKAINLRNITWGNLVDISDSTFYGMDQITLYPAALNAATSDDVGNPTTLATAMLSTPAYGADGRVSQLQANTFTGKYDTALKGFYPDSNYGVRAVGTASGMTDRQLDYRNARSAANTATAMAKTLASQSLNTNGSALANIAIEYGMGADTASYDKADVTALRTIIDDLNGAGGILDQIEKAYMQYILAYAASAASGDADTVWQAVSGAVEKQGATLDSVITAIGENNLPAAVTSAIDAYEATVAAVAEADTALQALETELDGDPNATFTWTEIKPAMEPLANPSAMTINGFNASEVKEKLGDLVSSVTSQGGLVVTMATGGGVYADVADQCGDFTASVTIEKVEYNGIVLNNMAARMETDTSLQVTYLAEIGTAVERAGAPESGGAGSLPISDMFGYIVDLAFRTNASESNLLLQVEATDRIYGEDNTNEETMGHGASMTFKATTTDFTDDQLKNLMGAIRIVFFQKAGNTVVATAKLDVANATYGADGWTAEMYLYELINGTETIYNPATYDSTKTDVTYYTKSTTTKYTAVTDPASATEKLYTTADNGATYTEATYAADSGLTYYTKTTEDAYTAIDNVAAAAAAAGTLYTATTSTGETKLTDNVIMPLTQNQATQLSVLVYLDGNNVGNDDVAATAATSMTGTMNLQFASSATLVPMEYTALHTPGNTTKYSVGFGTLPTDVTTTGATTTDASADYTFQLKDANDATITTGYTVTYKVGTTGTETTLTATDGTYTIPKASITGDITITVTANP